MYGSTTDEQRQANEVRRLKRELHDARDQVMSLSSQLSTNVSKNLCYKIRIVKTAPSEFFKERADLGSLLFFCHVFLKLIHKRISLKYKRSRNLRSRRIFSNNLILSI